MDRKTQLFLKKELNVKIRAIKKAGEEKLPPLIDDIKYFIFSNDILKNEYQKRLDEFITLQKDENFIEEITKFYNLFRDGTQKVLAHLLAVRHQKHSYVEKFELHSHVNKEPEKLDFFQEIYELKRELLTQKNETGLSRINCMLKTQFGIFDFYNLFYHMLLDTSIVKEKSSFPVEYEIKLRDVADFYIFDNVEKNTSNMPNLQAREIYKISMRCVLEKLRNFVMQSNTLEVQEANKIKPLKNGKYKIVYFIPKLNSKKAFININNNRYEISKEQYATLKASCGGANDFYSTKDQKLRKRVESLNKLIRRAVTIEENLLIPSANSVYQINSKYYQVGMY